MPQLLADFHRRLTELEHTRSRMESLYASGNVAKRDVLIIYEALFIRAVSGFEHFCEELFFAIVSRRIQYSRSRVSIRIKCKSEVMREIILQGDKYLDGLPYERTERRAELYLAEGKPFTELTSADRSLLQTVVTIRHAIAHSGDHAKQKFHKQVIGSQKVGHGERTPAGFLRSQFRDSPVQNRFQVYVAGLGRIAGQIT